MSMGNAEGAGATGAGQARASGYVGGVNALTGALQSGVPNYLMYRYMNPSTGGVGAFGGMGSSDINQMLTSQMNTGGML